MRYLSPMLLVAFLTWPHEARAGDLSLEPPSFLIEGKQRDVFDLDAHLLISVDLDAKKWARGWVLMPATLGLMATGHRGTLMLNAGFAVSLSGLESFSPLLYRGRLFPALTLTFRRH